MKMKVREQKTADSGRGSEAKETPKEGKAREGEENCRCKEVSKKNTRGLIKLMLSDLSFWKKKGPG